ncbi:hypothetical protein HAP41_0000047855 (plasmid) [Bradyrhizobium barranii subsp. apii]|uniref:Uncharacterized protein n=1 Tax=Bradyrhizobium barranii subsp. apii TaxID=2819348 RepID=A0A8T5VID4_9BRAD|nr:hypothetical protein HAP41_0000047855 [Bradyrhizobium barranii subsp. apii]UPU01410.1 hypothetical protein J4G48_0049350 [Bradyrhizobium barranii subsp. apii]
MQIRQRVFVQLAEEVRRMGLRPVRDIGRGLNAPVALGIIAKRFQDFADALGDIVGQLGQFVVL